MNLYIVFLIVFVSLTVLALFGRLVVNWFFSIDKIILLLKEIRDLLKLKN